MPLTETTVKNAKAGEKSKRLFDAGGLYLEISPEGGKWWRFKYRFEGKEKRLSLGVYPTIKLKEARERRDESRNQLANKVDPAHHRKALKAESDVQAANSFEVIAREWYAKFSPNWAVSHSSKIERRLELDIYPSLGKRAIGDITAPEVLAALRRIEHRGAIETAHRAMQNCSQVFRYAVATGRAQRDPTTDLRGALAPVKEKHHASITEPKEVGELLRTISGYQGSPITKHALQLAPLLFVRPGELRRAEWAEFDLDKGEWRIPATRMKMKEQHIVPLASQAVAILRELHILTGHSKFTFTGARTNGRPMSENTVNAALRRLDYGKEEMTGHGFRSMASTLLHELGWNHQAIERQLAHAERNAVSAAYNFAEHLPERRKMMQAWADYLDKLKAGAKVIQMHKSA